jgi:hypothetical protein
MFATNALFSWSAFEADRASPSAIPMQRITTRRIASAARGDRDQHAGDDARRQPGDAPDRASAAISRAASGAASAAARK